MNCQALFSLKTESPVDNSHEMASLIYSEKKFKVSSTVVVISTLRFNLNIVVQPSSEYLNQNPVIKPERNTM